MKKSFTLIELLVVIVVLGILATISSQIIIKIYETKPVAILFKKNKKFISTGFSNHPKLKIYDWLEIAYKRNDKNKTKYYSRNPTNNSISCLYRIREWAAQ